MPMMSTSGADSHAMVVTSPRLGTPGARCLVRVMGPGSLSATHSSSHSPNAIEIAMSSASVPEQIEATV